MALLDDVRRLSSVPALSDLEEDALRLLAFGGEARIFRAGDVLFRLGEASDGGYVLFGGMVELDAGNNRPVMISPPALIGASAVIVETVRSATAIARQPSSVLKISRDLFRRVLSEYPDSAARLRHTLARHVAELGRDVDAARLRLTPEP